MISFQSPLGEVVKESSNLYLVKTSGFATVFQSPLGEVVKETNGKGMVCQVEILFQSPLGEVVKETLRPGSLTQKGFQASNRRTIFYLSIRP